MNNSQKTSFFSEVKEDLKANGWHNKKISTAISTLLFNFGVHTLIMYRIQYRVFKLPLLGKPLSRVVSLLSKILTSCHISSTAEIEGGVSIPHPTGIVIGRSVIIKSGSTIYQQVTLGADASDNFPKIEANVTIYAGAKIVGGVTIGENAIVGANAVVVKNVAENSVVAGVPAKHIKYIS